MSTRPDLRDVARDDERRRRDEAKTVALQQQRGAGAGVWGSRGRWHGHDCLGGSGPEGRLNRRHGSNRAVCAQF